MPTRGRTLTPPLRAVHLQLLAPQCAVNPLIIRGFRPAPSACVRKCTKTAKRTEQDFTRPASFGLVRRYAPVEQWSGRMAHASKKKMGAGSQGKLDGTGAMTVLPDGVLPENMVLSNRDKAAHPGERGLDSRQMQTEQFHDHVGARGNFEDEGNLRNSSDALQGAAELDPDYQERVRTRAYEL